MPLSRDSRVTRVVCGAQIRLAKSDGFDPRKTINLISTDPYPTQRGNNGFLLCSLQLVTPFLFPD
ncbi:hypothetical protein EI77_02685 [Prosthecobacter fusiformis]|uniref:Uncharacterized protein n=1 Tax=Prosthecobacter fusiformis TaxID=48464 RepID=A0A4R7S100_9BACT|nr:hypothetical protein EI77_02685 [Prosthecobacter fusiformis]